MTRWACVPRTRILLAACALLLSACSIWSRWEETDRQRDPPFVQGERAIPKGRTASCAMCTTGSQGEYAFFGRGRGAPGPYYADSAAREALALVRRANDAPWTVVGKDVTGREEQFAPLRIIVVSLDPLVVAAVPWQYRNTIDADAAFRLGDEVKPFIENDSGTSSIAHAWLPGIRNVIELRGTLPAQATRVTLYSQSARVALALPAPGEAPVSVDIGRQRITIARTGVGPIGIAFAPATR